MTLAPGTQVGKYKVVAVLGQGGFGITYRAVDIQLDREVAIKEYLPASFAVRRTDFSVLPRSTHVAEDFRWGRERFLAEARTLARLTDAPGVVDVFDYLEAYGTAYMVMALVQGETLETRLKRAGRLPQMVIDQLLYPLLDGLEQVHEAGFLHRDIKPDNILMDALGRPTLIDFGASRVALQGRFKALTAVYTPGYAAVEQVASGDQGPWTDIYALSATLYHCITGGQPPNAIERMIADSIVPAAEAGKGRYSPGLLAAIDAGLSLKAEGRPQSIADWRRILADGSPSTHAPPARAPSRQVEPTIRVDAPRAKGRSRLWVAAAAVVVVCLVGAGAYVAFFQPVETVEEAARRADQEAQRQAELAARLRQQEEARKAAEEKARAEKAEAERQAAETARAQQEEEARRKTEAERLAAEEAQRNAEQQRLAAEETRRRADEERARQEAETARTDADRKAAEAARAKAEEEARRQREQERLAAEDAAWRKAEQERQAMEGAQRKADQERQATEAAQRRADEERRRAEAEKARIEAEQAAAADAKRKADAEAKARVEREKAEQDARRRRDEEAAQRAAEEKARAEAAAREKAEADARLKADAETRRQAEVAEAALKLPDVDRRRIQVALSALGFDTQGTDGVFGPRTRQMMMAWQKRQGYPETGYMTAPQLAALREQAASALAKFDEEQKRREEAPRATPPGNTAAAARCRAINARAQVGEPLSDADLAFLRNSCRG